MHTCIIRIPDFDRKTVGKCSFGCIICSCSTPPDTHLFTGIYCLTYQVQLILLWIFFIQTNKNLPNCVGGLKNAKWPFSI